ncbi:ABC transporter substrate-binding protein [Hellea balneolensis]|uniref:ABC transporter substrate-binding protein n=1 Tax=Hellea balneolensis TaxID=287478 RepID=UPI0004045A0A|nr:ABC transporter substrate-binding protein [Hellea balneolensis]
MNRRKLIKLSAAATSASILGLTACKPKATAKSKVLESAYIPILDSVPLIVAHAKGFFKEAGIKSEKPVLIRGWAPLLEAFESKQIQLTHILLPQVIFMKYARQVPVKSVAFNHTNVVAMLLSPETESIADLGGKIVGCPTWWAPHTGIFQDVLRKAGLTPVVGKELTDLEENEVAFRVVAPPDMPEALRNGSIAGCTVSEPFGAVAEKLSGAKLVKMSGDVWRDHPCCQSVMLEDTINEDPAWAEAVTIALYNAAKWAGNNPEELAEILGKDGGGYFPMPVPIVQRAISKNDLETYGPAGTGAIMHTDWNVTRVGFTPYPFASAFGTTLDLMRRTVVDSSAAMPNTFDSLTGRQIAKEIVDYRLANIGFEQAGGATAFGLPIDFNKTREEEYEVLLK